MSVNAISRRKTVLALVKEINEGVPVKPTLDSQYTALQEGFSINPSFNVLSNAELKPSIGKSKDELGSEEPQASLSHYIRASGVEGQDVDYKMLLEAAFGQRVITAVELDTVAGSTAQMIKLGAGEGLSIIRGQAFLIKDPVNGFQIRNALEITGDDVELAQKLLGAPAAGVNLGKAITYVVSDEGHPTFTVWYYLGNGGAIEMMAGARVTEMSITAQAGEYINGSFSIGGVNYSFNPIEVKATHNKIDFLNDADVDASVAVIQPKMYKDPHELAEAIEIAMNALNLSGVFSVKYGDADGKFTIKSDKDLELLFATGDNVANSIAAAIGFAAVDLDGVQEYTSANAVSFAAPVNPKYDEANAIVAKSNEVMLGGADDIGCFGAQSVTITLTNTKTDIPDLCEESGKSGSIISARELSVQVTYLLKKFDAEKFRRFRTGDKTQFTFNAGQKLGGQWAAGKCVNIFSPSMTITGLEIQDSDGLCVVQATLSGFVDNGLPELYMNFL